MMKLSLAIALALAPLVSFGATVLPSGNSTPITVVAAADCTGISVGANKSSFCYATTSGKTFLWDGTAWVEWGTATAATVAISQTGADNDVQITDGTETATVRDTGTSDSLNVAIVDAVGAHVTSFGGGTEVAQGTAGIAAEVLKAAGAIRKDTAAVDAGVIDGDRVVLSTDSVGRLRTTSADVTQPVSGTVTADAGTGTFVVGDGAGALNVIVDNTVTVTDGAGALNVICDSGCSGGTQYTEGDTDTTIVGTAMMFESDTGTSTLSPVNNTTPLPITGNAVVTGAIDLEFAGTAASTNTGVMDAGTQRVTIATDDPVNDSVVDMAGWDGVAGGG